jgi:hypothetical protein
LVVGVKQLSIGGTGDAQAYGSRGDKADDAGQNA